MAAAEELEQLTNVVFMPDAAAVIELLTCGYYSDTYRKFAVEAGLRYYASRDPAPGCDRDLGKRHHNDDRPVRRAERWRTSASSR